MCIAIMNSSKVTLKEKTLKNCWDANNDGAGLLYSVNGKLTTFKELKSFDVFYSEYVRVRTEHHDSNIAVHFRIATHGGVNETNCHPFITNNKMGFIHNGIISDCANLSASFSDTYMFNEVVLKRLPKNALRNEAILRMIESYIGWSKLVFIYNDNSFQIINEKDGVWDMGCWFSNSTYKDVVVKHYGSYYDDNYYGGFMSSKDYVSKYATKNNSSYQSRFAAITPKTDSLKNLSPKALRNLEWVEDKFGSDSNEYKKILSKYTSSKVEVVSKPISEIEKNIQFDTKGRAVYVEPEFKAPSREVEEIKPISKLEYCAMCFTNYGNYNAHYTCHVCSDCLKEYAPYTTGINA